MLQFCLAFAFFYEASNVNSRLCQLAYNRRDSCREVALFRFPPLLGPLDARVPAPPSTTSIDKLSGKHGSEQLGEILTKKDELQTCIGAWKKTRDRITQRQPAWDQLERLARHTVALPVHAEIGPEIEAIRTNRSLLDDTDHVMPLLTRAANALRAALTEQADALKSAYNNGLATLNADASWQKLDDASKQGILNQVGLAPPTPPVIKTGEDVLRELDRASLEARASATAAVPARIALALEEAARRLKPEARRITVTVPIRINRRGLCKAMILPDSNRMTFRPWDTEPAPLQLTLARGHRWLAMLSRVRQVQCRKSRGARGSATAM